MKVYESVTRETMWEAKEEYGVKEKLLTAILILYLRMMTECDSREWGVIKAAPCPHVTHTPFDDKAIHHIFTSCMA